MGAHVIPSTCCADPRGDVKVRVTPIKCGGAERFTIRCDCCGGSGGAYATPARALAAYWRLRFGR